MSNWLLLKINYILSNTVERLNKLETIECVEFLNLLNNKTTKTILELLWTQLENLTIISLSSHLVYHYVHTPSVYCYYGKCECHSPTKVNCCSLLISVAELLFVMMGVVVYVSNMTGHVQLTYFGLLLHHDFHNSR